MRSNCPHAREPREPAGTTEASLHRCISREDGNQNRCSLGQRRHQLRGVTRQSIGYNGITVSGMDLEIPYVANALLLAVYIAAALARADASDDLTVTFCDRESPSLPFESVEREKNRSAINT